MPTTLPSSTSNGLDPDAVNLAKAIRQTESGGNFQARGKSGEYGAYQFTKPTWDAYAPKHGVNVPIEQATPDQQNEVAYKQIKEWKDQGLNVGQISSLWNSGKPDAYLDPNYKGVNQKTGVYFDVPAYAKSVATAYQTLKNGGQAQIDPNNPSSTGGFVNPANDNPPMSQFVTPPENTPAAPTPEVPKQGLLSKLGHGALDVLNAVEKPFLGIGAIPVQLLAKATGMKDPYAEGFPGLAGSKIPVTDLNLKKKLGDAAQVGSYFIPGEGVVGALGMGALQGAGSAASEGAGAGEIATSAGLGAATAGLFGGATKLVGAGLSRAGEALSGEGVAKAVNGIKKAYSEALNLHAGERGFEARTGKDLAQVLMDTGASLGKHENGTLNAQPAIEALQSKLDPINQQVSELLNKPQGIVGYVSLPKAYDRVVDRINSSKITELEKESMISQAKKIFTATAKKHGTDLELPTSDAIKQGFWNTVFKRNITSDDALRGNVNYLFGNAIKDLEEKVVAGTDAGNVLGPLNEERSKYIDAIKRLTKLDGVRIVKGGKLGNMMGGITGTIVGASAAGPLGALAGDYFGTRVAEFLNNPANRIAIAQGKAKAQGLLPELLGKNAVPAGNAITTAGRGIKKATRAAGLIGNLLTNPK